MFASLLRVNSILHAILKLINWEADGSELVDAPFQVLEFHPHVLTKVFQILAYAETLSREWEGIIVAGNLVLLGPSARAHGWIWNVRANLDQS